MLIRMSLACAMLAAATSHLWAAPLKVQRELPNPYPRELVVSDALRRWDFADGTEGWRAVHHCQLAAADGVLKIRSTGIDPYLAAPVSLSDSSFVVRLRMRSTSSGPGQFFWSSTNSPGTAAERVVTFRVDHDGQWHEYQTMMKTDGDLTALRLDPASAEGDVEVDWLSIHRGQLHPLEITRIEQSSDRIEATLRNHGPAAIDATVNGKPCTIPPDSQLPVEIAAQAETALAPLCVQVEADPWPAIERTIWAYREDLELDGVTHTVGQLTVVAARDGSEVRLKRNGQLVAALAPLVHSSFRLPELHLQGDAWPLTYEGPDIRVQLSTADDGNLRVSIDSKTPVEGPVVRAYGDLEQGLLAGVEYLGRNEVSSSKLDIETAEHMRVEPDPMDLTMPLMAFVTDRATVAMLWQDTDLQPTFAVPDFLDGVPGQRMSLKGQQITATLRITEGWPQGGRLEPVILWAVKRRGLPPLPRPPRSFDEQMKLCLAAYRGLVHDPDNGGWFHAVVPGVRRSPAKGAYFADCVSAIWRITGQTPETAGLAHGGSHVRNSASYFVTGRAEQWLTTMRQMTEGLIRGQRPDGSYRYSGPYRRGHFEDTASGICARPAYQLLDYAYYTGDKRALAAGLKTLEYIKRFRTPRGSQTWEVPLHTPDILASGQAVWAYTRAYQLTGDRRHLVQARRWAVTGLPFVYQWANQPTMMYATTPVLGATNWKAPNWIGLPVQWCGTVYAYALLMLAPYDDAVDWRKVAEGITICGEQMQYPDGPSKGTLPDVFNLANQSRHPADINPGAMVSLRLLLEGRLDALAVAVDGPRRVLSPYPVVIKNGKAVIQAPAGTKYQVLIDGTRIQSVTSQGTDVIELSGP